MLKGEGHMRRTFVFISVAVFVASVAVLVAITSAGSAFAADLPKEGRYDFNACWSRVSNVIAFSKTHSALSYEMRHCPQQPAGWHVRQAVVPVRGNERFP